MTGELFYGVHLSDESLMTCYVQSVEAADHIHFIEGGDGGYAGASRNSSTSFRCCPIRCD
ncbi:MAG: DUF3095 family protein [Gammaproteobacteria bacterium]|nr:DUF3095 family protein [Gammaproteobacteria bacterium]